MIVHENIYISSMTYFSSFYVLFKKKISLYVQKYTYITINFLFFFKFLPLENRIWKFFFAAEIKLLG